MSSADERVRFARAYAAKQLPWFAPALFRSRIIITDRVEVASIDLHYNVFWNPRVVGTIWDHGPRDRALAELGFLWIHEISHRLREHAERARELRIEGPAAARYWNIAADFEINDSDWKGLAMPAAYPGMLPEQFGLERGQLAGNYYTAITEGGFSFADQPDEGSGVHHQSRDWEEGDLQTLSELDREVLRRDVAERMRKAGNQAIPEGWRNWSATTLTPKTDWRRSLSHRMSVSLQRGIGSRIDYSFARPNRRQSVYHPILTPALRGDKTARIAVVVDTSGSVDDNKFAAMLAEVGAILKTFQYPVTLIPTDRKAYEPVRVMAERDAMQIKQLPGGGGTDMKVGIRAALDLRPIPDSILVLTDGFTPYPTVRFARPVIFGILHTGGRIHLPPNPPWTPDTTVRIEL